MFRSVFAFEIAYWFKRPLTLLFFALLFLMGFFSTASDAFLGVATGNGRTPHGGECEAGEEQRDQHEACRCKSSHEPVIGYLSAQD